MYSIPSIRLVRRWAVAAVLLFPVLSWAGEADCLVLGDQFSALKAPAKPVNEHYARVEILSTNPHDTQAACDGLGVRDLSLTIEQGQRLEFRLLVDHKPEHRLAVDWEADGTDDGWLSLTESETPHPGFSAVTLTVDGRGRTQSVSGRLTLQLSSDSVTVEQPIDLRIAFEEETPLFRNRFEVEPLPGQFSQRPMAPGGYVSITLAALP